MSPDEYKKCPKCGNVHHVLYEGCDGLRQIDGMVVLGSDGKPVNAESCKSLYNHYFKDVSKLQSIDVYRVLELFEVVDPAIQHAVKKLLCAGDRGHKDRAKDVQEAIDSLNRWKEMRKEDGRE